jgi:hypothetical protein
MANWVLPKSEAQVAVILALLSDGVHFGIRVLFQKLSQFG